MIIPNNNDEEIAMYVGMILPRILEKSCSFIHRARQQSLLKHVQAVINRNSLLVSEIGRGVDNKATTKSNINMADRFVSNAHIQAEREAIYIALGKEILKYSPSQPVILVDWTSFPKIKHHMLRASIVLAGGRGNTLYEKMFEEKEFEKHHTHEHVLTILEQMLPKGCKPIIVTDAGFRGPWFKAVQKRGWDFVGRIRNLTKYRLLTESDWHECRQLHGQAGFKPRCIGEIVLGKRNSVKCRLYVYKQKVSKKPSNKTCSRCKRKDCTHSKSYREPWVISTSLSNKEYKHLNWLVTKIYKKRMKIEQEFRDLKTLFGFKRTQTQNVQRLNILLLLGMLANWVAWVVGFLAEQKKLHYQFQANTIKNRRVLSFVFLGLEFIRRKRDTFSMRDFLSLRKVLPLYFL